MLTEAEKRAAQLAVSRYGADIGRMQRLVRGVLKSRSEGQTVDLVAVLLTEEILSDIQVRELRLGLEKTQIDPNKPTNGVERYEVLATVPPLDGVAEPVTGPPIELRSLGEYRILRRLGEGGTGTVFLAYQESENRQVAIKVLSQELARNQPSLDRFYREAKSGALLNHPNIVRNLASGQDQATGYYYLVLEFVDGDSALDLLERFGSVQVADAVYIVLHIARALEHAHSRNVVHRDIKPGNILITQGGVPKLADLGLAKRTDETSHLTHARQGFGTPYYMPYEQAMNAKYADARSDIYALGATFYHLLVGDVPFPGVNHLEIVDRKALGDFAPASAVNPDVPKALDAVLAKMLAKEPKRRYQTASELIVDLERTNLAASVPSFVNPEVAMRDPVVRKLLTSPAQTTFPDIRKAEGQASQRAEVWNLRFRNAAGEIASVQLDLEQIEARLRDGSLPRPLHAAPAPSEEFQPLEHFPQLYVLVNNLAPVTDAATTQLSLEVDTALSWADSVLWWWVAIGAVAAILFLLVAILFLRT